MDFVFESAEDGSVKIPKKVLEAMKVRPGDSLVITAAENGCFRARTRDCIHQSPRQLRDEALREWIFNDDEEIA